MNKEAQPLTSENAEEDAINEKIKQTNEKSILGALWSALGIAIVITACSPFSRPFFSIFTLIICFGLTFLFSFVVIYQILFYCFGKELIPEAKKRGKYLVKNCENTNVIKSYTETTPSTITKTIIDYGAYDAINTANGNPPGMGYIGAIRNRD